MTRLLFLLVCGLASLASFSQQAAFSPTSSTQGVPAERTCASHDKYVEMMGLQKFSESRARIEQHAAQWAPVLEQQRANGNNPVVNLPVVFHILYNTSTQNISDAQIMSQLQILNDDFRRTNSDADDTWSQAADSEIEFCLATIDPNGNATDGILRVSTSVSSFGTNDNMKFSSSGGSDAWPAGSYLNFWVCNIGGGILGYAQFPGGPTATDGVVCGYQYVGNIGTASAPFNLGRTATHEVGHWLNLRHIWGDGGCGVDDLVADTPESDASNFGCATGHVSCGSADMVQNYMDYSDDACMNLYTSGQAARMQALFAAGGARSSLLTSNGCAPACETACGCTNPAACNYDSSASNDDGSCDFSCFGCTDPTACNFDSEATEDDGSCIGSGTSVTMTLLTDDYPAETSWNITDAEGASWLSGGAYTAAFTSFTASVCLADGCYTMNIFDSYGDGICCGFGDGSYSLADEAGNILASGGSFGFEESTDFCIENTEPIAGCMESTACNYNSAATETADCTYASGCNYCSGATNGTGTVMNGDSDGDGVCDGDEVIGCSDEVACNYIPNATDEGDCEYALEGYDCDGNPVVISCPADINGNGSIEVADLLLLLGDFGCTADCTAADVNQDGFVNVIDVLLFLATFGEDC